MQTPNEDSKATSPESPPLIIGAGVKLTGTIEHTGHATERAVVIGEFVGDINWNGVVVVPTGGSLVVTNKLKCREMVVGGKITGEGNDVVIEAGLMRLSSTSVIDVATISVPPGGLEQSRGSRINAKLLMTEDSPYFEQESPVAPGPAAPRGIQPVVLSQVLQRQALSPSVKTFEAPLIPVPQDVKPSDAVPASAGGDLKVA